MTEQTKALVDRLQSLSEDEQERLASLLLEQLDETEKKRSTSSTEDDPYGFQVLIDAKVDTLPPDYSSAYEQDLYGRTHDLD